MADEGKEGEGLDEHGGFAPVFPIELLAEQPIVIDEEALFADMIRALGPVDRRGEPPAALYFLPSFPVELADAKLCAQVALLRADRPGAPEKIEDSACQSWRLEPEVARARAARAMHSILLTDFMSSSLGHDQRRTVLSASLRAALRNSNVELVHFALTQQFLDAEDLLERLEQEDEVTNPTAGFLNVRFFNIAGTEGDMVMDTLGLTALGLTDFQVHFRGLDPSDVASTLQGLGRYCFEKGPVIESGHTVEGVRPGSKWRCQAERSLIAPYRVVLDLNPGPGFAAGRRT